MIDNSGVLASYICEPIREYLKIRDDTVRTIVTGLTDSENSALFQEVKLHSSTPFDNEIMLRINSYLCFVSLRPARSLPLMMMRVTMALTGSLIKWTWTFSRQSQIQCLI